MIFNPDVRDVICPNKVCDTIQRWKDQNCSIVIYQTMAGTQCGVAPRLHSMHTLDNVEGGRNSLEAGTKLATSGLRQIGGGEKKAGPCWESNPGHLQSRRRPKQVSYL